MSLNHPSIQENLKHLQEKQKLQASDESCEIQDLPQLEKSPPGSSWLPVDNFNPVDHVNPVVYVDSLNHVDPVVHLDSVDPVIYVVPVDDGDPLDLVNPVDHMDIQIEDIELTIFQCQFAIVKHNPILCEFQWIYI